MIRRARRFALLAASISACFVTWSMLRAADCNQNEIEDADEISSGTSKDCNSNGIPDECDLFSGFSFLPTTYSVGALPFSMISPDLNGDAHPDLVTANKGAGSVSILINNGHGVFSSTPDVAVGTAPQAVRAG